LSDEAERIVMLEKDAALRRQANGTNRVKAYI